MKKNSAPIMKNNMMIYILGSVVFCGFIVAISVFFVFLFLNNDNSQTCAVVEVSSCAPSLDNQNTYIIVYVENTCSYNLEYVQIEYYGLSVADEVLISDVVYAENLGPGESTGFAPIMLNPGGNVRKCTAKVVKESQ